MNNLFTKLEVDIKSAHRNKAKCEAKVKAYEEEVESLKAKLTTIEARMVEIEKTAKVCMDEFQELQKTVSWRASSFSLDFINLFFFLFRSRTSARSYPY